MHTRRPVLDEDRLKQMQARASRVWRGESQPQVSMAEDILLLVAEVRLLRQKAKVSEDSLFSGEPLFSEVDALFRKTSGVKPAAQPSPKSTPKSGDFVLWKNFRTWWRRL